VLCLKLLLENPKLLLRPGQLERTHCPLKRLNKLCGGCRGLAPEQALRRIIILSSAHLQSQVSRYLRK
jgi:hypothetical protein